MAVIHETLQENAMRIKTFNIMVFVFIIIFVIKHLGIIHSIILFRKSAGAICTPVCMHVTGINDITYKFHSSVFLMYLISISCNWFTSSNTTLIVY